jgi:2'-5' RNA ligase
MPVAIALRFDAATSALIDAMRDTLPDRQKDTRHPAHIRLAVYDDHIDVNDLDRSLATVTAKWKRVSVILAGVGVFPPSTLWLAPVPSADLMTTHATLHTALANLACDPRYKVGAWLPHVALATTEFLGDAIEVVACAWTGPIAGTVDFLDLVRVDSTEVISSRPLWD